MTALADFDERIAALDNLSNTSAATPSNRLFQPPAHTSST
jgi:hypothetical protein